MAEEPQVIAVIRIIFELIWTLARAQFEVWRAVFRCCVPPAPKDISEDIVLITGAGHGMGREMALRFARLRATVVCVDINPAGNQETFDIINAENGKVHKYQCDVTDRSSVFKLAETVQREVGDVTILVNNAGIMPCKPLLKHSEKEIRSVVDINVLGNLWTLQAFLPSMLENNHGHVVAMSSMAGRMGLRNLVPYCGTKYAVRGIMDSLAIELFEDPRPTNGIKLTTIYPYIVSTGLCHKPRIRFESLMSVVSPATAADQIVDAVLRNYHEITVPSDLYYTNKIYSILPPEAGKAILSFAQTGLDAHE